MTEEGGGSRRGLWFFVIGCPRVRRMERDEIAARLRRERYLRGWDVPDMARKLREVSDGRVAQHDSLIRMIHDWERTGRISERYRLLYAAAFEADPDALFDDRPPDSVGDGDVAEALELTRRATASDVGAATLDQLELAVDELATAYPRTPPAALLERVRQHLRYVVKLLDGRATLREHRRLLVAGGWLSLLAATCAIDIGDRPTAAVRLRTAAELARETEHAELAAWCLETTAWQELTDGHYRRAVELSQEAQRVAPRDGSVIIQATAQEGRAWARLGAAVDTRDALARVEEMVAPLSMPDRPEHHFRYDPAKAEAYIATTLSWIGDPAAERIAREVLVRLERGMGGGPPRPRRAASARLDLSMALIAVDKHDEAASTAMAAVESRLLVPSNYWRAAEVAEKIEDRGVPEAARLREAFADIYGSYGAESRRALT